MAKLNEIVEVEVLDIREYGAIVKTLKENLRGIIHISEIAPTYIENVSDYFYEGEIVEAKIIDIQEDNNLSLSTKDLNKHQLKGEIRVKNKEMQEIKTYLKRKIGILSPVAEEKLKKIVNQNGFFSFTKVMSEIFNEYGVDFGALLMDKIERELDSNPFEYYKATDHALESYCERFDSGATKEDIIKKCYEGLVIMESNGEKYVVNENMFFPVVQEGKKNWVIKTVLHWDDVKGNINDKFNYYSEVK